MSTKYTPEPWYLAAQNDLLFVIAGRAPSLNNDYPVHDAVRTVIARVEGSDKGNAEADANGQLLAASPELLKACRRALAIETSVTQAQERELRDGYRDLLRAAIAKADGAA